MSSDLLTLLLQFQPEAPELKDRREYDLAARNFVQQVTTISPLQWQKGADTPQDVLTVCACHKATQTSLTCLGTRPRRQLDSLRVRPPPSHRIHRRQAQHSRLPQAWRPAVEQAGAMAGDVRSYTDALRWERVEEARRLCGAGCARSGLSTSDAASMLHN
jgi:hypothetical protein